LPALRVPQLDFGRAAADDLPAVRAEHQANDGLPVPRERENLPTTRHLPHLHRLVRAAAGEPASVRAEGHVRDGLHVAFEDEDALAPVKLCYPHRAIPVAASDPPAVRAVRDLAETREGADEGFLTVVRVPHHHRFQVAAEEPLAV